MSEQNILAQIIKAAAPKTRLFREHSGVYFNRNGTRITIGFKGKPDAVGLTVLTITPEMVGKSVAVYTAIEAKKPGGSTSQAQKKVIEVLKKLGAIAGICYSIQDFNDLLDEYEYKLKKQ